MNELPTDQGCDFTANTVNEDLPSLEDLFGEAIKRQTSQKTSEIRGFSMVRLDDRRDRLEKNEGHETCHPAIRFTNNESERTRFF